MDDPSPFRQFSSTISSSQAPLGILDISLDGDVSPLGATKEKNNFYWDGQTLKLVETK